MLGPYPECGDYEMVYGPWGKAPSTNTLQELIARYSQGINGRRGSAESRAQEYLLRFQYEEEQAETKRKAEYEAMMRDHISPLQSSSLAASRWRQELARRTGNGHEHIGSCRWGRSRKTYLDSCYPTQANSGLEWGTRSFSSPWGWAGGP